MRLIVPHCLRHPPRCSESPLRALRATRERLPLGRLQRRSLSDRNDGPSNGLYHLLFPEEASKAQREEQQKRLEELSSRARAAALSSQPEEVEEKAAKRRKQQIADAKTVLVLKGASKNLIREDFLRIIPQGKNLEGWVSDKTYIEKIVQDRDMDTLERKGTYYLIFKTAAATAEYQKRAIRISKLFNFHGPASMVVERQPPPGLVLPGEDMKALLRSYHLTPCKTPLRLYQPENGLPADVAAIAECGGLPQIVNRPGKMPAEVALRLPLAPLTLSDLKAALRRKEIERNLPWTGAFTDFKCEEWVPPSRAKGHFKKVALGDDFPDDGAASMHDRVDGKRSTFIVGLQTQPEAEAFVRYWHCRKISTHQRRRSQVPVLVEADVL